MVCADAFVCLFFVYLHTRTTQHWFSVQMSHGTQSCGARREKYFIIKGKETL